MVSVKIIRRGEKVFKDNYEKVYQQPKGYRYAICLKIDNIPIGYVHVSLENNHDLGYGLRKEFWNKGIVTEACKAIFDQVKTDEILYITATHDIKNIGSGKVMEKLGMSYKYSYKEQWQPKDIRVTFRIYQLNFDGNEERVCNEYWDKYQTGFIEIDV